MKITLLEILFIFALYKNSEILEKRFPVFVLKKKQNVQGLHFLFSTSPENYENTFIVFKNSPSDFYMLYCLKKILNCANK